MRAPQKRSDLRISRQKKISKKYAKQRQLNNEASARSRDKQKNNEFTRKRNTKRLEYTVPYFPWEILPVELFVKIAQKLRAKDVDQLRATCTLHKNQIDAHRHVLPKRYFHSILLRTHQEMVVIGFNTWPDSIVHRSELDTCIDYRIFFPASTPSEWVSMFFDRFSCTRLELANAQPSLLTEIRAAFTQRLLRPTELLLQNQGPFPVSLWQQLIDTIRPKKLGLKADGSLRSLSADPAVSSCYFLLLGPGRLLRDYHSIFHPIQMPDIGIDNASITALRCEEIHYRGAGSVDTDAVMQVLKEWLSGARSIRRHSYRVPFIAWPALRTRIETEWPAGLLDKNVEDDSEDSENEFVHNVTLGRACDRVKLRVEWNSDETEWRETSSYIHIARPPRSTEPRQPEASLPSSSEEAMADALNSSYDEGLDWDAREREERRMDRDMEGYLFGHHSWDSDSNSPSGARHVMRYVWRGNVKQGYLGGDHCASDEDFLDICADFQF